MVYDSLACCRALTRQRLSLRPSPALRETGPPGHPDELDRGDVLELAARRLHLMIYVERAVGGDELNRSSYDASHEA